MTIVAGIDLGLSGAIGAIENDARNNWRILWAKDMPIREEIVARKIRNRIHLEDLRWLLASLSSIGCVLVTTEQMGFRSGPKGAGDRQVAYGAGLIDGMLEMLELRHEHADSGGWKSSLKVPAVKSGAERRALELFPGTNPALFRGPQGGLRDGRPEACMIALHGARRFLHLR